MKTSRRGIAVIVIILLAGLFFYLALNREVREVTSPREYGLHFHVLLRKLYSVVAFGLMGYAFAWWRGIRTRNQALLVGLSIAIYSAGIEVVQWWRGSHEGRVWNAADILMGLTGGLLGALLAVTPARSERH
ncbi:MAG: VanZ family protein [Candidatus Eremiobacteraeota bacterium]|nr:VanZ family protein [Candidatus Eremiobacteraeota bacterium]